MEIIGLLCLVLGVVVLIFAGSALEQDDYTVYVGGAILGVCFIALSIVIAVGESYDEGYETGQIDSLTGEVRYELKTNNDSTRLWIEKDE